jgi:hypothetical protein
VEVESDLPTREERFAGLSKEATIRIENATETLSFLLLKRDERAAATLVVDVVQLLAPLTGLDGAVKREDLSTNAAMKHMSGSLALVASQWGGKQDIDLVLLFTLHRQHFERLSEMLRSWRKKRARPSSAPVDPMRSPCTEDGCAMRAADRAAGTL